MRWRFVETLADEMEVVEMEVVEIFTLSHS